jgi:hypothetical protein
MSGATILGRWVRMVPPLDCAVHGDEGRVGLGAEAAGRVKHASSGQGIHVMSSDLRSLATRSARTVAGAPLPSFL